jgi:hypothetical protein
MGSTASRIYRSVLSRIGVLWEHASVEVHHPPPPGSRVLVLGIYLANRANTVQHLMEAFGRTQQCHVEQRWIALNGEPATSLQRQLTVRVVMQRTPKFQLLNELLADIDLSSFDDLLVCDDDVRVPHNFVDAFIGWKHRMGFGLAQPARTLNSHVDHRLVRHRPWLHARRTRFVEIGPVFCIDRSMFDTLLPFDEASPMGWGYDLVWPMQVAAAGGALGVIDATPVDHSLRGRGEAYSSDQELLTMAGYLAEHPHLLSHEAFQVIEHYPRWRRREAVIT